MKNLFKITTNTAAQIAARFVTTATTLIVTLLVTHNLSKSDWGIFVTITSFVSLFYVLSDLGLNSVFVREILKNKEKESYFFGNLVVLRVILSIITVLLALAVLSLTDHSNFIKIGIIISLSTVLTISLFNTCVALFQAKLKYDQAALADVAGSLVTLVLAYLFVVSSFSIIFVVIAYSLGSLIRALISIYLAKSEVQMFKLGFDRNFWSSLLFSSLPVGLTLIFSQFAANIDKQVVYLANYQPNLNLNNDLAAAYYGLAYRIFEFGIILPAFFVNSAYPFLLHDKVKNPITFFTNFLSYGKILLGFGVATTISIFVLGDQIIGIFGDYQESLTSLRILALGYPIFFITPLLMWTIISLRKEKFLPLVYGFAALFNFAANFFFVPRIGFNAASIITVLTEILILVSLFIILLPLLKENDFRSSNKNS